MLMVMEFTRAAIYTRVSTDNQAEIEFNSCEAQENKIRAFISSQDGHCMPSERSHKTARSLGSADERSRDHPWDETARLS
jgi:DNA invertase Pin-like site-specific DNA recombinase